MYRASTPLHVFEFDIDPEEAFKEIQVTYVQDGSIVLEKTKKDFSFDGENTEDGVLYKASFRLTQEETKRFSGKKPNVLMQIRFLDRDDNIITSPTIKMRVEDVLNDGVLK